MSNTLSDSTNTSPLKARTPQGGIKFTRGGIAKSNYRRKSQATNKAATDENGSEQTEAGDWWIEKKEMVLDWLRCNPLLLGISRESVNFVKKQLERGDENASLRSRCWKHVVVEMSGVPGLDEEMKSVAEIPLEAEMANLATILGGIEYSKTISTKSVEKMSAESLRRLLVQETVSKASLQTRVEDLSKQITELKNSAMNMAKEAMVAADQEPAAGSSINAIKALSQRPSSQPSSEDEANERNAKNKLPQRPLTDRSVPSQRNLQKRANHTIAKAIKEKIVEAPQPDKQKIDISKMSMLERNAHFQKIRQEKLEKKRLMKAEAEQKEVDLASQKKKSNSRWNHVRSKLGGTQLTAGDKKDEKKKSTGSSLLDECRSIVGGSGKPAASTTKDTASSKATKNWDKVKKSVTKKQTKKKAARRSSRSTKQSAPTKPSLLDLCTNMLKGTDAASKHGLTAGEVGAAASADTLVEVGNDAPPAKISTGVNPDLKLDMEALESSAPVPVKEEAAPKEAASPAASASETVKVPPAAPQNAAIVSPSPPKEIKFFDETGSNDLKGKFVVQSPTKFAFDSFYRKRDKGTIQKGVSLLMARHEDTSKEEAVAIYFDRSKFSEEQAAQWWETNSFRFSHKKKET